MFNNETKYFVEYGEERLTLREFADRFDVNLSTVRGRYKRGIRDWRELINPAIKAGRPKDCIGPEETEDYSLSELWELYKGFAGNPEEGKILADFAGVQENEISTVLKMFRRRFIKEGYEK